MKTAREIIAEAIETPPIEMPTPDMVIAALAAEGFSIVETGRDPVTIEAAAKCGDAWDNPQALKLAAGEMTAQELRTARAVARGISSAIRALSRSTREGKTE